MSIRVFYNLFAKNLNVTRFYSKSFANLNFASFNRTRWSLNSARILPQSGFEQIQIRNYAKSKDKGKNKKGGKVEINPSQLNEVIDFDKFKTGQESFLQRLHEDNATHLTLRSSVGSIESLKVYFGGKEHEVQELAQVLRKNTKTVQLQMAAFPAAIPNVMKTLQESGMNLNPQQEGNNVFVPIPKVTKEHREHLTKNARVLFVKCRNSMKELHMQSLRDLKKQEKLPEDLAFNIKKQLLTLTDEYVAKAKAVTDAKCKELMQIE